VLPARGQELPRNVVAPPWALPGFGSLVLLCEFVAYLTAPSFWVSPVLKVTQTDIISMIAN